MKAIPLSSEEQRDKGFSHLFEIVFTDLFAGAGLVLSVPLFPRAGTLPAGSVLYRVAGKIVTPFVGCTTLAVDIGDGGTSGAPARFLAAQSLLAAGWFVGINAAPQLYTAADNFVSIKFTATVNNLPALTAGKLQVFLSMVDLNQISRP